MPARAPLRVWVLSDGQPGHYNLSRGIVTALRRITPVEEHWMTLKLRVGLGRNLLRFYLNHVRRPAAPKLLRAFYRMSDLPGGACDLIVSAGGKTSFANTWLARYAKVPNVYAGSLRRLSWKDFSAVLSLEPIEGAASNLVVPVPPSSIEFDDLQAQGKRLRERLGSGEQRYWLLLAGGNGAGYRYGEQDWLSLTRLMNDLGRRYGIRWLVASSRRTGSAAERRLKSSLDKSVIAATCWYSDGDKFRIEACLGSADAVFVTEDSMTMLTEAIYSRRPVYSLRPVRARPNARYERMVDRFAEQGFLCRYEIQALSESPELLQEAQCRVLQESPLVELAERLGERLGLL